MAEGRGVRVEGRKSRVYVLWLRILGLGDYETDHRLREGVLVSGTWFKGCDSRSKIQGLGSRV